MLNNNYKLPKPTVTLAEIPSVQIVTKKTKRRILTLKEQFIKVFSLHLFQGKSSYIYSTSNTKQWRGFTSQLCNKLKEQTLINHGSKKRESLTESKGESCKIN